MVGVGIDLLDIDRLEAALARRPNLALRLFADQERSYADARARPGQHLAARFCAKEAVTKALALAVVPWQEIEVVSPPAGGPPRLRLSGTLAEHDGTVVLSLSHTDTTAGAVAIVAR